MFKQNIKSCNAKLRRQRRTTVKNNNRSQKSNFCTSTLFFYISLPLFCMTTTWNFQKLLWRKCRTRSCSLFFFLLPLMFTGLPLVATSISHVVTAAITKFSCHFSNKKVSFVFLSLALDLCRPFYRWASLACRLLSRFLCLSLARLYSRFVGTPINLSLIYFRQYGYRNNFHFSFSSIFTL